ncbi:hypothetical protein BAMA_24490 [Bacillus manliponensis]|uniref:ABC transporter domain-containing protein n=1 Tax=Bacillus manliponensis TaxID=574376 RepID=A0A073JXZ3_9BACI|nr:hypothetical protein BAMA_24490 [Bacillus manliponensis]
MIAVKHISKFYKNKKVLQDVSLHIEGVYGLVGPNGAGKTTLMRALAGLIPVNEGSVTIDDINNISTNDVKDSIAYLPQDFTIYPRSTVDECLHHIAVLKGIKDKQIRRDRVDTVLQQVNLQHVRNVKVKNLSGGMRKRVGIAQMFLTEPSILIIDEPTAGLDISERIRFRNLLRELSKNKTIIISSHIVEDVEFLCTKIGVLQNGIVLQEGAPSHIAQLAKGFVWEFTIHRDKLAEVLKIYTVIHMKEEDHDYVRVKVLAKTKPFNAKPSEPTLLDGYLSLIHSEGKSEEIHGAI